MKTYNKEDPQLISYKTIRKAIGWFGISLPTSMIAGNFIFSHCHSIQDSISHYYYTITGSLFVGILCSVALFLIAYKGYPEDTRDNWLTNIAGVFAIGIAFFPTNSDSTDSCAIFTLAPNTFREILHIGSAALFFLVLAYISIFLFTKNRGVKTPEKIIRNKIYRICGVIIVVCVSLIGLYWLSGLKSSLSNWKPVFWLESSALFAFGVSWLVKGELVMEDTDK